MALRGRLRLLAGALAAWAIVVLLRLVQVQVIDHTEWLAEASRQQEQQVEVEAPRGEIRTRDGRLLAGSLERVAIYANPRKLPRESWPSMAVKLSPLTGLPASEVLRRLGAHDGFFYLARDLDPAVAPEVARLRQRGIGTLRMERREYPHHQFAAAVVGFVDASGTGQAGLEASYDRTLAGTPSVYRLLRDGKSFPTPLDLRLDKPGRPGLTLRLTLDSRVQQVVEEELSRTLEEVSGAGAAGVVMDPTNGQLLAIASLPTYDPASVASVPSEWWRNRAVEAVYEPGSVFKPVIVAAALANGSVNAREYVDCSGGGVQVAGAFIRDHANYGVLPLRDVLAKSSNAGTIRIAHRLTPETLDAAIRRFGFGRPTGVELPAEGRGLYHPVEKWSALSRAGLAIGQEISVTPLQIAQAYAAMANHGVMVHPTLVLETLDDDGNVIAPSGPNPGKAVLSPQVAGALVEMLSAVVDEGTGRAAAVSGFQVGGKTGTAQKAVGGSYASGQHVAWFAGFLPLPNPRLVIVVCIDQPEGSFWASDVAAPAFGRIAARLVTLLGLRPGSLETA